MKRIVVYDQRLLTDKDTLQLAQRHARARGRSVSSVVREALQDWFSSIGEARIECHREREVCLEGQHCDKVVSTESCAHKVLAFRRRQ